MSLGKSQLGSRAGHAHYAIPDVQVLKGTIRSMFHTFKSFLNPTLREFIYFHYTQVSFPSKAKRLKWELDAAVELE